MGRRVRWSPWSECITCFRAGCRTVYFTHADDQTRTIMTSYLHRGKWSAPKTAEFSGRWRDIEPAMSPDGSFLIFVSNRPVVDGGKVLDGFFGGQTRPGKGGNLRQSNKLPHGNPAIQR